MVTLEEAASGGCLLTPDAARGETLQMAKHAKQEPSGKGGATKAGGFSALERNILKSKGLSDSGLEKLVAAGVGSRDDFRTVGDAATLADLAGLSADVAGKVMAWAIGTGGGGSVTNAGGGTFVVESGDIVNCLHCKTKQPKDYKSGDLCISCGKQAEPSFACAWCSANGPGKFCRNCGAEFVPTGELELAICLKREGVAKDEIAPKLRAMSASEKEALWGRVRRSR